MTAAECSPLHCVPSTGPDPGDDLVQQLAADLARDVDALVDRILLETAASDGRAGAPWPAVRPGPRENVRRDTLSLLRAVRWPEDEPVPAGAVGADAAQHGVPLDVALHPLRVGGRVIWDALAEAVREGGFPSGESVAALIDAAQRVRAAVAVLTAQVAETYLQQDEVSRQEEQRRRDAALDALLTRGEPAAATALGLTAVSGPYAVVLARHPSAGSWAGALALEPRSRLAWAGTETGVVAVVALGVRTVADLAHLLARYRSVGEVVVTPAVEEPTGLPAAYRLAVAMLRSVPEGSGRLETLESSFLRVLLQDAAWVAGPMAELVLGPVLRLPAADSRVLLDTLESWVAHDGSVSATARALFCHRNTVLNRLHRLASLTGRSVERPRDLVELSLALAHVRRAGREEPARPAPAVPRPRSARSGRPSPRTAPSRRTAAGP